MKYNTLKKTLLILILSTFALTSFAQTQNKDSKALSTYIAHNFNTPLKAMSFYDMPERLENALIMLNVELTPAGTVNTVEVSSGVDELFDNTLKTFIYLIPKGVCPPSANGKKHMVNVIVRVNLEPLSNDVARLIEMREKRRRFLRIKDDAELRRQVPEALPYLDKPGTSLWILRSRAYQLTYTPVFSE